MYFKFPVGHNVIHVGDRDVMLQKGGFIKFCVLPPTRLYHHVLSFRCNNKLFLCLSKSCATECNTKEECAHETLADRALTGAWVIDEVRLAIQKGYEVIDIF